MSQVVAFYVMIGFFTHPPGISPNACAACLVKIKGYPINYSYCSLLRLIRVSDWVCVLLGSSDFLFLAGAWKVLQSTKLGQLKGLGTVICFPSLRVHTFMLYAIYFLSSKNSCFTCFGSFLVVMAGLVLRSYSPMVSLI